LNTSISATTNNSPFRPCRAYRELIFDYERKLDGSLSLSLPVEPSYRDSDPPSTAPTDNVPVVPAPTSPPVIPPAATSFPTASTTIATPTPTTVEPIVAQEDQTASQNGESSEAVLEAKTAGEGDGEGVDALFTALTVVLGCAAVAAVAAVIVRRRARASGNSSQGTGSDYSSMQSTTANP